MQIRQVEGKWLARKNKKAKTEEDITDIIQFDGDFASVMGKAGRTEFHSYLGKSGSRWLEMHGVTSLLNYWGEKERLIQWAVDRAVDYIAEAHSHSEVVLKDARSAHKRSLKVSSDHGTDRHELVETWIKGRMEGTEVFDERIKDFIEWANNVRFLASEKFLRSKHLWLAGTADGICVIDGKTYIFDLKTSNYVSYKHFIQCGAYALMYEEMGLGKIDGLLIVHMPRDGGFKVHTDMDVQEYQDDMKALVRMVKRDRNKSYALYS